MYGNRQPAVNLVNWAKAIAPEGTNLPGEAISQHQILKLLSSTRFEKPEYYVGLQGMETPHLLRELINIQSVRSTVDWKTYELLEQMGAMIAAILAQQTEKQNVVYDITNPVNGAN